MNRWRQLLSVAGAFALLVAVAVLPGEGHAHAAAPQVLPGEPAPLGMPYLPTPSAMHVTIDNLTAIGLTVKNNVTIRLSDGTTVTTTQYTFTQLQVNSHMHVTHTAPDGTALTIDIPAAGSLGGLDTAGQPETTVMWGTIDNICVTVLIPICGVQGLLNFFGSFIKLNAGASGFDARVYGIQTIDNHAALSSTDNPVHLPGTITVTTP
ncbi:hypothetical protein ABT095_18220 [Kitasatospora sp. NPDC002227]|uniref:hypothetical protein n=1 Tax=Kitasatospora sp. NPDC002227 TaxID=3154773 RepID=UPI00332A759F